MSINILKPSVYNLISAGEVVENPASIVKELVENSIDAGATQIEISIEQGGVKSINIVDNGCGIAKDELYKTVLPHATSKISDAADLSTVSTLGFRGEALASIAAVSETVIKSRYYTADSGAELKVRCGETVGEVADVAYNKGTCVSVTKLFFNTPARFKFLRSPKAEEGFVTKLVSQLILSNPDVAIRYIADGLTVYNSDGSGLKNAVTSVYKGENPENFLFLYDCEGGNIRLSGYISDKELTKNNKTHQTLIVNGRVIADQGVAASIINAYGERLMQRRFPVYVISIVMPFDEVDVNVHPNKREVRFANPRNVCGAVYQAVKYTLDLADNANARLFYAEQNGAKREETATLSQKNDAVAASDNVCADNINRSTSAAHTGAEKSVTQETAAPISKLSALLNKEAPQKPILRVAEPITDEGLSLFGLDLQLKKVSETLNRTANVATGKASVAENKQNDAPKTSTAVHTDIIDYKVIGQLFNTYILVERGSKLLLIDQHAAHERLIYDKLMSEVEASAVAVQPMLVPYVYENSPKVIDDLLALSSELTAIGFDMERFCSDAVKINAAPLALGGLDFDSFMAELVLAVGDGGLSTKRILSNRLALAACKAAIKGGADYAYGKDKLDMVISYFFDSGMPLQCPHGRPTYIELTQTEIEKLFRRKV